MGCLERSSVLVIYIGRTVPKGICTHTGKTGAESDSSAGCDVNKWVYSHAAGPRRPRPIAGPAS
jgi:hypothetical protein